MGRLLLHCARSLPDWGSDDADNTRLVHDTRTIINGATTGRQLQEVRRERDPREPDFDELPANERAALNGRVGQVQAAIATFVPPGSVATGRR